MALSADGTLLYATQMYGQKVRAIDVAPAARSSPPRNSTPSPTRALLSADGQTLFVSVWGGAKVVMLDRVDAGAERGGAVGEHPNAMALTRDGSRLFVACANTNAVWVVDRRAPRCRPSRSRSRSASRRRSARRPTALALSPDGRTLVDRQRRQQHRHGRRRLGARRARASQGWIPVGWYPTGVLFDRDGSRLFVLDGKGLTGLANPRGPQPGGARIDAQYSARMFQGSALGDSDADRRRARRGMTARVRELTPYSDAHRLAPAERAGGVADPATRRRPVADQIRLLRDPREPHLRPGARRSGRRQRRSVADAVSARRSRRTRTRWRATFATFDNFYVDAEVSYDGHAFSTGAYATDFVEKMWPANYGRREGLYLSEGGYKMRNPFGNIAAPPQGYIWDFAKRANVTYRSYGEFAEWDGPAGRWSRRCRGSTATCIRRFPPFDMSIPDDEADRDLRGGVQAASSPAGTVPRLSILRLPRDHTSGTVAGADHADARWSPTTISRSASSSI